MQALTTIVGLLIALSLTGCQAASTPASTTTQRASGATSPALRARFDCDTLAVTVTVQGDQVTLELPDRTINLPQVAAASGTRFSNDQTTFWSKGRQATLEIDGSTQTCRERRDPWQEASDRGVEFRAVGEEPGWFLELGRRHGFRLVYDYAEHAITFSPVSPVVHRSTRTYDAVNGHHHLHVVIENRACNDVLSGESFPAAVSVTLDHKTLKGCGRSFQN